VKSGVERADDQIIARRTHPNVPRTPDEPEHYEAFARASQYTGPTGVTAAATVFAVAASWYEPGLILRWWCAALVVAGIMLLGIRTSPRILLVGHVLAGLLWSSAFWLDLELMRTNDAARWCVLAFTFAISAGVLGALSSSRRLGFAVLVPMWLGTIAGLAITAQWVTALGSIVFLVIVTRDHARASAMVADLIRLRMSSQHQATQAAWEAHHDRLTGLLNRAGLEHALADGWTGAAMFVDLDHFKEVNDRLGHQAGDRVLREAAQRLEDLCRSDDTVGRFGGDEFIVLARGSVDYADALAARIIRALELPFLLDGDDVFISGSIGIAAVDADNHDLDRVVRECDRALYEAKATGRRRTAVFDERMRDDVEERLGLESALRRTVRERAIQAWGQPIVDLATGRVVWVELLARWVGPNGTMIPPATFIPIAESIGVIGEITEEMLRHAARAHAGWRDHDLLGGARLSVNVSAVHLNRGDLVRTVSDVLGDTGLDCRSVMLELTESSLLSEQVDVAAVFTELREMGVAMAIDDFGTGFSSLSSLVSLPVDAVKIDRSLVEGLDADGRRFAIARSIAELTTTIGRCAVAEGVETTEQLRELRAAGFTFGQGHLFCTPMPLDELAGAAGRRLMRRIAAIVGDVQHADRPAAVGGD
jgi:diguanylate cyclase (GGDEF)-like protein